MKKLPNGFGGISYLGKGRRRPYVVRLTIGTDDRGYPIYKILGYYETRTKALDALMEYHKYPYDIDNSKITLQNLYDKMLSTSRVTTRTKTGYKTAFNHLKNLWDVPYIKITANDILSIAAALPVNAANQIFILTTKLDKTARMINIPIRNISDFLDLIPSDTKKQRSVYTSEEIALIWQHKSEFMAKVTLIYLYTGWRKSELLYMKKECVNMTEWTMKGGIKNKYSKNRTVPIHTAIRQIIEDLMQTPGEYLLGRKFDNMTFHNLMKKFNETYGIKHVIHECRHTFRTELDNQNVSKVVIDRLMGHVGDIGEAVYTHKTLEQLREGIERISYLT